MHVTLAVTGDSCKMVVRLLNVLPAHVEMLFRQECLEMHFFSIDPKSKVAVGFA